MAVTLGATMLAATVAAVAGAVAYAWFVGSAGSEELTASVKMISSLI